jgi:hypothetical protein
MTATRPAPAPPAAGARPRPWLLAARILRTEIRHSAFIWCLPLLAVLFFYDPYRTAAGYAALWPLRSTVVLNNWWPDMVVFAAGFSAWAGSREGRRNAGDLLATTARPAWTRQLCSLAGTACWVVAAFLAGVIALYVAAAQQATWGGPPIAPVGVGVVGLLMVCAVAFTLGALFPGRFTAPVVAIALMIITLAAFKQAVGSTGGAVVVLSPDGSVPDDDWGLFHRTSIGVPVVQVMFMGGVALAAVGLLGLSPRTGGTGWRGTLPAVAAGGARLRIIALSFLVAGVALLVASFGLAGTGTGSPAAGYRIPVIDGNTSSPVRYTPVCSAGSFPVCLHPAYRDELPQVSSTLGAAIAELAGLPGVPDRGVQVAQSALPPAVSEGNANAEVTGGVYEFSMADRAGFAQDLVHAVIVGSFGHVATTTTGGTKSTYFQPDNGTTAQEAVEDGLLKAAGSPPYSAGGPANSKKFQQQQQQAATAAARFAALPAATRHAWLTAHLAALKAGTITVAQVP